jgi:hypothetical protein
VAASGALALAGAGVQSRWLVDPAAQTGGYLALWCAVAAISVTLIGAEMWFRWLNCGSEYTRRQMVAAIQQFAPSIVAGALLTGAIARFAPEHAPLYPALWCVIFSLGIFASQRQLPAAGVWLAVYYLLAALACIRWGLGPQALQPWTMAVSFGGGQLLTAAVLSRQQEPSDGRS